MNGNKHMKTITNIIDFAIALFAFGCFALAHVAVAGVVLLSATRPWQARTLSTVRDSETPGL